LWLCILLSEPYIFIGNTRTATAIQKAIASSGRFVLATNVTDSTELTAELVLLEYKGQQSPERRFLFLKDRFQDVHLLQVARVKQIANASGQKSLTSPPM
jgi:transposase